jgi:hypothetical protein
VVFLSNQDFYFSMIKEISKLPFIGTSKRINGNLSLNLGVLIKRHFFDHIKNRLETTNSETKSKNLLVLRETQIVDTIKSIIEPISGKRLSSVGCIHVRKVS